MSNFRHVLVYLLNIIPDIRNLCFAKNKKIHHTLVKQSINFQREWKCQPIILSNVIYVNFIRYSRVILLLKLHMKIVFSSSGKPRKPQRLTPTFEPEVWPDKTTEETSWEDKLTPRCHCFKKSYSQAGHLYLAAAKNHPVSSRSSQLQG